MSHDPIRTSDASAVLRSLLLDRTITNFATNFETVRRRGVPAEVMIWIKDEDELSLARVANQIQQVLRPLLGEFRMTVEPDPWIPRPQPPANPPEAKEV